MLLLARLVDQPSLDEAVDCLMELGGRRALMSSYQAQRLQLQLIKY